MSWEHPKLGTMPGLSDRGRLECARNLAAALGWPAEVCQRVLYRAGDRVDDAYDVLNLASLLNRDPLDVARLLRDREDLLADDVL